MPISKAPSAVENPDSPPAQLVTGQVRWFDLVKGYGFMTDAEDGEDILLHANILRNFGQSSILEGAVVRAMAIRTRRGQQVVRVLSIAPPPVASDTAAPLTALEDLSETDIAALPLLPARVKWFDRLKGFGFANVFGHKDDVFLHIEVLHRSGLADLYTGEAIGLRIFMADRGPIAAEVAAWTAASSDSEPYKKPEPGHW